MKDNIMKKIYFAPVLLFIILFFVSCDPSIDNPIGTRKLGSLGTNNQSLVYVAIGTSISAGGMDQAVYPLGQKYCFPKLLSEQIGVSSFVQADIEDPGIGKRIYFYGIDPATGLPKTEIKPSLSNVKNATTYLMPFNNLGVYAAVANDLIDTSDFSQRAVKYQNPFYPAILRSAQFGKSMVDQAIALKPDLLTVEMGSNDILWYAIYGSALSTFGMPDDPMPTPTAFINQIFTAALTKLTQALPKTKIILFNIPNVLGLPYFHTVPWNALALDEAKAAALNQAYSAIGFKFKAGQNGFVVESPKSPGKMRQMTANDYLLLSVPQDSLKLGYGSSIPVPNQYVLDSIEIQVVINAVNQYNDIINNMKSISSNIYIFDLNQFFIDAVIKGYPVPGSTTMSTKFVSGEMISMDGIHATPKGYGALTNELIKFLNKTFNSDIPMVNIQNLPAITVTK
jgi:lysophospholipase L1-like esterase